MTFEAALSASAQDFRALVWPRLVGKLGGGYLLQTEDDASERGKHLDQIAGIDAWQVLDRDAGMRGLATRVQWRRGFYETWTIRRRRTSGNRTEWDKIVDPDWTLVRPALHIQAYIDEPGGKLLGAAAIRTSQLVQCLLAGSYWTQTNGTDGTEFACVSWEVAEQQGMEVWRA